MLCMYLQSLITRRSRFGNDVAEGHATLINQQAIKDKYIYKTSKLVESGLHAYASLVRSIF